MGSSEYEQSLEQFGKALDRLREVLARSADQDGIVLDAAIQRFELTFELCWKMLKRKLNEEGVDAAAPRAVLQQAHAARWLNDEQVWLQMLQDRNLISRSYREEVARSIHSRLPQYETQMRSVYNNLTTAR